MITVKLTTIGNSTGVILSKEVLQRLRVTKGDVLFVLETPNGIELTPYDPRLAARSWIARPSTRPFSVSCTRAVGNRCGSRRRFQPI